MTLYRTPLTLTVCLASVLAAQDPDLDARRDGRHRLAKEKSPAAKAVLLGLDWLHRHQSEDGRWDADGPGDAETGNAGNALNDIGVTGLALLAFLGDGVTDRVGPYQETVARGLRWLRAQQDARTGLLGTKAHLTFIYDHAIGTYALCEACALTDDEALAAAAQKGLDYLEAHRNPYKAWRYQPRDGDNDTSVTAWALLACTAGARHGLKLGKGTLSGGQNWLEEVTDPATGQTGYTRRGEPSSRNAGGHAERFPPRHGEALTAAALLSRLHLGQSPASPVLQRAVDAILAKPPQWGAEDGRIDHYYWFFATQALHLVGGDAWQRWNTEVVPLVAAHQSTEGDRLGSWDPVGVWGEQGGRVYSTALMVMTLQAPYRSAPAARGDQATTPKDRAK